MQLNMLAEVCFVPIARLLFMHPEKLMVRICSWTFDMFHMFIINLMWLNFVIFYLRMPSVWDSFWLLGTKVSCNITPILHCPRFSFIQIPCIMNFVRIPDKVPYVTKLVKVCAAPCGTSKINFSHIWPSCRWNIIHALDFLSGVEQNLNIYSLQLYLHFCIIYGSVIFCRRPEDASGGSAMCIRTDLYCNICQLFPRT